MVDTDGERGPFGTGGSSFETDKRLISINIVGFIYLLLHGILTTFKGKILSSTSYEDASTLLPRYGDWTDGG